MDLQDFLRPEWAKFLERFWMRGAYDRVIGRLDADGRASVQKLAIESATWMRDPTQDAEFMERIGDRLARIHAKGAAENFYEEKA